LWHPEPAERSCAAGEATQMAFSYRLFMHVMCDVLAKRHFGNGMVEYGRFGTLRLLSLV